MIKLSIAFHDIKNKKRKLFFRYISFLVSLFSVRHSRSLSLAGCTQQTEKDQVTFAMYI